MAKRKPVAAAPDADESPKVRTAADAVGRARAELKRAEQLYEKVRVEATEKLKRTRSTTLGELWDGTLKLIRNYPGPSVIVAVIVGFFLGRSLRR